VHAHAGRLAYDQDARIRVQAYNRSWLGLHQAGAGATGADLGDEGADAVELR
jgi:hypothetical protein